MFRTLLILAFSVTLFTLRADDATSVVITVVTLEGKPAVGAKVWIYEYTADAEAQKEPKPLVADAGGKVVVVGEKDLQRLRLLFVRDSADRIGSAWVESGEMKVVLADTAPVAGRVTNPDGKPVAGAVVTPQGYYADPKTQRDADGADTAIALPTWEQTRLAATTNAQGQFKLSVPVGYSVTYSVKVAGGGESRWIASAGAELETKLFEPGTVAIAAAGVDPAILKRAGFRLAESAAKKQVNGVRTIRYFSGTFDAAGKATVSGVVPGKYTLMIDRDAAIPAIFEKGATVEVVSGKSATVTAKFTPAAKVTGKVTDHATGKGLANVQVTVNVSDGTGPNPQQTLWVKTDANGVYTAYGPAGWYRPFMQGAAGGVFHTRRAGSRSGARSARRSRKVARLRHVRAAEVRLLHWLGDARRRQARSRGRRRLPLRCVLRAVQRR